MTRLDDAALARLRQSMREPDLSGTRYQLDGVAGTGGMGTVYVVRDTELGRRVALKVLDVQDPEVEARLRREAEVLARLEHPGIVPVHDVGRLGDGRGFYTMKLVQGERLDRYATRDLSLPERLRVFLRIAEAVAFAHAHGVLHRDLKPQNVMIGPFGEVLVLDWGLAKVLSDSAGPAAAGAQRRRAPGDTGDGAVLGTPGFMAPEQAAGESGAADVRADVFSLGALLQSLLPSRPAAPLLAIARKAMSVRPEDRYGTATGMAGDVDRFLEGAPVSAYPENLLRKALRVAARHRVAAGILAAYLVGRGLILLFTHR
ncbi:MAG: serine/threonine protein kinase [Deltaproteobacteria bacterium]|nr:MAG: serine/threonine protein kinase [Deltaproteobacteria bacterium]